MASEMSNKHNKKEILVVTVELGDGGAERVLSELMGSWVDKGHNVTLIQTKPGSSGHSYKMDKRINNICFRPRGRTRVSRYFFEILSLLKYLRKHQDATVVALLNASIRIVGVCSLFTKNRIVFSERCDPRFTPPTRIMRWLRDQLFKLASVCVFQTEDAKKLFPNSVQRKGVVIPNPINPELPQVMYKERNKVILTACRLHSQKNVPMLIQAYSKLIKEYPEYSLHIYGTGEEKDTLQQLIDENGITDKAILMGHSSDIYNIMQTSAMYVCTSNYEGLSNSLIEALCMGMPVISTDHPIGGARAMITDKEDGLLIPVGDVDALYQAMKYLIENPEYAEMLGENAQKLRERWPVDTIADRWLDLF